MTAESKANRNTPMNERLLRLQFQPLVIQPNTRLHM
jgi:hypothetical protein